MGNKLPKVFANKITKKMNNNEIIYYGEGEEETLKEKENTKSVANVSIEQQIDKIFSSRNYVYKAKVNINLKNGNNTEKEIIGRDSRYLITIDNEKIPIQDINKINLK